MEEGITIPNCTCDFGAFQAAVDCRLTFLPAAQLAYLHVGRPSRRWPEKIILRTDAQRLVAVNGSTLTFADPSVFTGTVFLRSASAQVAEIARRAAEAPPEEASVASVRVDFDAPCYQWRVPVPSRAPADGSSVQLRWNVARHHLSFSVAHKKEYVERPFWGVLKGLVHNETFLDPPGALADLAPPSCYIDAASSPDCSLFEPHTSRLGAVLECLGLRKAGLAGQTRAADFLRRVLYGLRGPTSPREVARLATRAAHYSSQWDGDTSTWPMPGRVAECLGLGGPDAPAGPEIAAVGCHLPMASVTGFGLMYSGLMDESTIDREQSVQKAALMAGGWRVATAAEEERLGHAQLVWHNKDGEPEYIKPLPIRTIAEFPAPSICARVVADRLRRVSFLKYDKLALFGRTSSPLESLVPTGPDSIANCVQGKNPGGVGGEGSNCRHYVGCAVRLMRNFNRIPGVPAELVDLCTGPGRGFVERDRQWMGVDNAFWMTGLGAWAVDLAQRIWSSVPGQGDAAPPPQLAGFRAGDVVRLDMPGAENHGNLFFVESFDLPLGFVCMRRHWLLQWFTEECFLPRNLRHVPEGDWTTDPIFGLPVMKDT